MLNYNLTYSGTVILGWSGEGEDGFADVAG